MGKILTIHGTDFSQNGIPVPTNFAATPYQGYVITNSSNPDYGKIELSNEFHQNSICTKILIPGGKSALVWVNNDSTIVTGINLGYIASQNDQEMEDQNLITGIEFVHHPADDSLREPGGKFWIQNTTENDLYFYINFCYDVTSGPEFPISGKHILYS